MRMNRLILAAQAVLVAALAVALATRAVRLGVAGEWEWLRVPSTAAFADLAFAALAVAAYAVFAAVGMSRLSRRITFAREAGWLAAQCVASVAVQVAVPWGAPAGMGLTKWATLGLPGANGYFTLARREIHDPWRFWASYPEWVAHQDALHIGTHPPGLLLWARGMLVIMDRSPTAARTTDDWTPAPVRRGIDAILGPLPRPERAAYIASGFLVLLLCASTVVPIYLLARASLPAPAAWAAASLWPLVPSAILFQPTADTAYPAIAASALALTAWAARGAEGAWHRRPALTAFAGAVLGLGMQFSLVFLPIGLIVAIVVLSAVRLPLRERILLVAATGLGFLAVTLSLWAVSGANPFVIWWWNQKNHARFYVEYPRTYAAWVIVNIVETAIAIGLPVAVWALAGFVRRSAPAVGWATLVVLLVLDLSGRNLSEVARLWLPLMPPLFVVAGHALESLRVSPPEFGATVLLLGSQTLALQATIQVVYPV